MQASLRDVLLRNAVAVLAVGALLFTALLIPAGAEAAAPKTADEIRRCVVANTPDISHVQAIELVSRDRVGNEREIRAHVYTRRESSTQRRVLVRFDEPPDLAGSAFLVIEREQGNELLVRSPDLPRVKRIMGQELLGSVAGTDLSYEDVQYLRHLERPGRASRLDDAKLAGRSVYVIETVPAVPEESAYRRIRSFVDQETCLVARVEFYERGGKLRKELVASPERFRREQSVWVANEAVLRDVRDGTETRVVIETFDVDADIPASLFTLESLEVGLPGIRPGSDTPVEENGSGEN